MYTLYSLCSSWAVTVLLTSLIFIIRWLYRPQYFPKGPRGLPILGVIPFLGKHPPRSLWQWSRKYGNVMSIRVGRTDVVVLSGYSTIYEAFVSKGDVFSGRVYSHVMHSIFHKGKGISFLDFNEQWKSQKNFGTKTIKGMGPGRKRMEERVMEEMEYLTDYLTSQQGKPFNIAFSLSQAIANMMCNILLGQRFDYDDKQFMKLSEIFHETFSQGDTSFLFYMTMFESSLRFIPPFKGAYKLVSSHLDFLRDFVRKIVDEHEKTLDKIHIRDFCDAYLVEVEKKNSYFEKEQLIHYIQDLLVAAIETSTSTMRWSILCLIQYEETQDKIYKEIEEVIGIHVMPRLQHKRDMHYTRAFIEETMRFRGVVPLTPSHKTSAKTTIGGCVIPKNTEVIANLWSVNNDADYWKNPEEFNVERHLDEEGRFVQSKRNVSFSLGPRQCLGKDIAQAEIFLFLVNIIQKFKMLADPNASSFPSLHNGKHGSAFVPAPFDIVITSR